MGRDFRRDHSFRVPRPDVSKAIGSPNACNQCHTDQSVDWAVSKTSAWYGKPKKSHYGVVFHQSNQMSIEGLQGLKKVIFDNKTALIVRITAIDLLQRNYPDQSQAILNSLLNHKNTALRFQSVYNSNVEPENANQFLILLKDPIKAIRSDAAMKLSRNPSYVSEEYKEDYDKSLKEYLSIINYNIDFPDAKLTMADYYHSVKDYKKAEEFYKKAIKQDNQLFAAQINLAYLYNATNRIPEAILVFDNYLKKNPYDFQVFQVVGLLLGESGDYKKAAIYLEKAKIGIAQNERIVLNLAKIYAYLGEKEKAERYFASLVSQYPTNSEYYLALFEFYTQQKNYPKAKNIALSILQKFPQIPERKQIEYYINTGS
jgi:tetratricopeptide (TPR) repeat protein